MSVYTEPRTFAESRAASAAAAIRRQRPELSPEQAMVEAFKVEPSLYATLTAEEQPPRQMAEQPRVGRPAQDAVMSVVRQFAEPLERRGMTPEAAVAQAMIERPELYRRYIEAGRIDARSARQHS